LGVGVDAVLLPTQRALEVGDLERGRRAEGDVEVDEVTPERLDDGARPQVGTGAQEDPGGRDVVDDLDPDRRTAEPGLEDVRTGKAGLGLGVERGPGQGRDAGRV